jgi:hypothetical protein
MTKTKTGTPRVTPDDERRRKGAFHTPRLWVERAHRELERELGPKWRRDCVVWDPAAGTGNLTMLPQHHDYGMLFSSTLDAEDVALIHDRAGGMSAHPYDFLGRGPLPPEIDCGLRKAAAQGKRLVFFMNPPYGTAAAGLGDVGRAGMTTSAVSIAMTEEKFGAASQQLFAQFLYQAVVFAETYGFTDYTVAFFGVPTLMTSGSFRPFREWWYARHGFGGGFFFQASQFADVSDSWGISFTLWSSGRTTSKDQPLQVHTVEVHGGEALDMTVKRFYNTDDRQASDWAREPVRGIKGVHLPSLTSGLKLKEGATKALAPGALAYFVNNSNAMYDSATLCAWGSLGLTPTGFSVTEDNWFRAVALYAARKLVPVTWQTGKDEYAAPTGTWTSDYTQWVSDCHAYVLLHHTNNCAAMRGVSGVPHGWVRNHWFWLPRASCKIALSGRSTPCLLQDLREDESMDAPGRGIGSEAYFARLIRTSLTFSEDAAFLIQRLSGLWSRSLPLRERYYAERPRADKSPDLHLHAWDAGVYQLKNLWRELYPAEWQEVQDAHRALAERLVDGVYTYGFLRR